MYRDWTGEGEYPTHKASEEGRGFQAKEKVDAVRVYCDGGVRKKMQMVKNKVGAGWISQLAEQNDDQIGLHWKTVVSRLLVFWTLSVQPKRLN